MRSWYEAWYVRGMLVHARLMALRVSASTAGQAAGFRHRCAYSGNRVGSSAHPAATCTPNTPHVKASRLL